MSKKLEAIGKCPICDINLYDIKGKDFKGQAGIPSIFPCNVLDCPFEDATKQDRESLKRLLNTNV